MEYYIELIIFQEFVVDFILLYITGSLLYRKVILKRLIAATIVGVFYTLAVYSVNREFLNYFIIKFLVSVLMVTIAHAPKGTIEYIKAIICFYVLSMLLLGIIVLSYFVFSSRLTIIFLFSALFLIYVLFKILFFETKKNIDLNDYLRDITIYLNGNKVEVIGFIDTGNELVDALSNKPVVIVEICCLKDLFNDVTYYEIKKAYDKGNEHLIDFMLKNLDNYNFRLLRYDTIDSCDGYMLGVVPSRTIMGYEKKHLYIDCIIGIYPNKLSNDNRFQALLYKKLLSWEGESIDANEYY